MRTAFISYLFIVLYRIVIYGNQHWQYPKKCKTQPETQKQLTRWQKIHGSKEREIQLISKKISGRRNEKLFKRKND